MGAVTQKHLEMDAALPTAASASELSPHSACRESSYRNAGHIKISFKKRPNSIWGMKSRTFFPTTNHISNLEFIFFPILCPQWGNGTNPPSFRMFSSQHLRKTLAAYLCNAAVISVFLKINSGMLCYFLLKLITKVWIKVILIFCLYSNFCKTILEFMWVYTRKKYYFSNEYFNFCLRSR